MFTKCPKCSKSDQVTCVNRGIRFLAIVVCSFVSVFMNLWIHIYSCIYRRPPLTDCIKAMLPEKEYYCKRCNYKFTMKGDAIDGYK